MISGAPIENSAARTMSHSMQQIANNNGLTQRAANVLAAELVLFGGIREFSNTRTEEIRQDASPKA